LGFVVRFGIPRPFISDEETEAMRNAKAYTQGFLLAFLLSPCLTQACCIQTTMYFFLKIIFSLPDTRHQVRTWGT
jgi:hypothetical protein